MLLCAVIALGSSGTWAPYQPGIWAPTLISVRDVAQNVLLYVPFGALGVWSFRDSYRRHWLRLVARIVGLAILFSASVEALQLYTNDRVASAPLPSRERSLVIALAMGDNKLPGILAAVTRRLVNGLITDERTAAALLAA